MWAKIKEWIYVSFLMILGLFMGLVGLILTGTVAFFGAAVFLTAIIISSVAAVIRQWQFWVVVAVFAGAYFGGYI